MVMMVMMQIWFAEEHRWVDLFPRYLAVVEQFFCSSEGYHTHRPTIVCFP